MGTSFQDVYKFFDSVVTDDMYLEWTKEETFADLDNLIVGGLIRFEFPRFNINSYHLKEDDDDEVSYFDATLTTEEVRIVTMCAICEWIDRQILDVDLTKQKYTSHDFNLTSQANHLSKLQALSDRYNLLSFKYQRLYKRRVLNDEGIYVPNYDKLKGKNFI